MRHRDRGHFTANIISLTHSTKLNAHEPYAYLRDVLERLPTHKASQVHDATASELAAQRLIVDKR
ncbi:transposase domain-containing protein [Billgrantia endophytica]|uniref:Transposase IS66 C-terminal domain-containing protein n=1 Tax=Billgrantia endophytica TaxID=2033802 RepID=A0A2N7UE89_9GAMM|nr:hypothetical protein C1H69_00445 [Halomonas endophytica]